MAQKTVTNTMYAEHRDDPKSWLSPRPAFNVSKFQKDLERRGGFIGSVPRFRLRWAGECDEYIIEEYDTLEGYVYRDEKGHEQFVAASDTEFEFPDGCIPAPYFESHKVCIPRWVIEEYREPFYQKFWTIHEIEQVGYESGRVDLMSHYREPSEVDLVTIEAYIVQKATLSGDDIRNALAIQDAMTKKREDETRAEFVATTAEQFEKAMKDGLPNSKQFGFNPKLKFNIQEHSKNLIKEHDKNI